ncbi:MAG: hypothetical protein KDL10_11765, partial [Kiritimatiellae bacterium]|nr:hypothetical protein [Kiritimatiellia bacterium]
MRFSRHLCLGLFAVYGFATVSFAQDVPDAYAEIVRQDAPVAWWRFDKVNGEPVANAGGDGKLSAVPHGALKTAEGPRPSEYPDFSATNEAVRIPTGKNYFVVDDPDNTLAFRQGEAITLEAWVRIDENLSGSYRYIIGKGRTYNPGTSQKNQNYSLRLLNAAGGPFLSFFFVDEEAEGTGANIGDT